MWITIKKDRSLKVIHKNSHFIHTMYTDKSIK